MTKTPDLDSFYEGFGDGYHGRTRRTGQGGVYLRAYAKGREAGARRQDAVQPQPSGVLRGVGRSKRAR